MTPALADANNGNWQTAQRWAALLAGAYRVHLRAAWNGGDEAVLVALHARRSADSIAAWRAQRPDRPCILVLTGTDLYRDIAADAAARRSLATADRLVIADNQNRVLVYGFDGQAKGTIAGHSPEVSPQSDLLTVRTEQGELELYDLSNVQKRATYDFKSRVAFNGFSGDGKRLLALTADQVVYVLDTSAKVNHAVAAK